MNPSRCASAGSRRAASLAALAAFATCVASPARADERGAATLDPAHVGKWLDERSTPEGDLAPPEAPEEAPPPPPPRRGFVIEGTLGALGHFGPLRHVSPTAPWVRAIVGYEIFRWAMVLAESDLSWTDTSYARPPPGPRTYSLFGFGGGARFTVRPVGRFGLHLQGSIGAARVSDDVLETYGYRDANQMAPYFGAGFGLEWYQTSPHYALVAEGGIRNYSAGLDRQRSTKSALAWTGGLALRYVL